MSTLDGDEDTDPEFDAWTGMPIELDDLDIERVSLHAVHNHPQPVVDTEHVSETSRPKGRLSDMFWKMMAASSASTPGPILACLAVDDSPTIRKRVAENARSPADVLDLLASDSAPAVRVAVARNSATPPYLLRKLSIDESADVRLAIAANPDMPDAILLSLFLDPDPFVAERASKTLEA
jgi:hypothetical protein